MKKFLLLTIIFLFFISNIFACLNESVTKELKNGAFLWSDDANYEVPIGHYFANDTAYLETIIQLDSLYKATNDIDYLSDKGLLLIIIKRYDEAIKLYFDIERVAPDRYSTASNLGTAYELIGQNKLALQWIKKSVSIDPASHQHSEWLHVKILEAKINGGNYINSAFLINTNFGNDSIPASNLSTLDLEKLSDALYFQLNERVTFIKPKDKIVGLLLFELANTQFLLGKSEDAMMNYELAEKYGFNASILDKRTVVLERYRGRNMSHDSEFSPRKGTSEILLDTCIASTVFLLLFLLVFFVHKERRKSSSG